MRRRKDRNRQDKTTGQKISGTVKAASATIAGVAFLRSSNTANRFVSEVFPAAHKAYKGMSKELSQNIRPNRRIKASDIEKAFDNNFNSNLFRKRMNSGVKSDTKTISEFAKENSLLTTERNRGIVGVFLDQKRYSSSTSYIAKHAQIEKENKLKRDLASDLKKLYKNKYSGDQINQLMDAVYLDIEKGVKNFEKDGTANFAEMFKKKVLDDVGIKNEDRQDLLRNILLRKKDIKNKSKEVDVTEASKKIDEILNSKDVIRSQNEKYIYNRIDKFLNKFGINIDSELYFTGSKAVRLKDLSKEDIEDLKKVVHTVKGDSDKNLIHVNIGESIENLMNDPEEYGDLILDKSLRIRQKPFGGKEIFSTEYYDKYIKEKRQSFSSTIIGKIMYAGIDVENQLKKPFATMIHSNKISSFAKGTLLNESYLYLNGKAYSFSDKSGVFDIEEVGDVNLISTKHGKSARIHRNTLGTTRVNPNNTDSELMRALDIGQNGKTNIFRTVINNIFGSENEINEKGVAERIKYTIKNFDYIYSKNGQNKVDSKYVNDIEMYDDLVALKDMLDYHITKSPIDDSTYKEIRNHASKELQKIFDAIDDDDLNIDDIFNLMKENNAIMKGSKLDHYIKMYDNDPNNIYNYISIQSNPENTVPIIDIPLATTNVYGPRAKLKEAVVEEFLERDSFITSGNFYDAFKDLDLSKRRQSTLNAMSLKIYIEKGLRETNDLIFSEEYYAANIYSRLKRLNVGSKNRVLETIDEITEDFGILNKGVIAKKNAYFNSDEYNSFDIIKKSAFPQIFVNAFDMITNDDSSITGKDLIKGINDTIKELTIGGRNNKDHYTMLTMLSQYSLQRLSMGVEEVGLGLSAGSMASPLDTLKNIALKRVLPAMVAFNALDYLDFEAKNLTGVSLTGAAANVASNTDLALRNIADHTGIGFLYDQFKNTSVIAEYLTGSTDYQDRDEREEWYRTGESVVRKARFWSFGSASEFRGTSISYYQPNYLRRAHSNWKEVGIYGDPKEKWAHSPLPSLRYPLSPIRFLLDPYWLEKKNFDERPYPLTAKMFSEGTPWGAILNPTVGQLIKPVRMLPEARRRLKHGRVGEDVNNVLYRINERIKNKESRDDDMVLVNGTDIRNAEYIPFGHPNKEEYNIVNGTVQGISYMDTTQNISTYSVPQGTVYSGQASSPFVKTYSNISEYVSPRRKKINNFFGEMFKHSTEGNIAQELVNSMNRAIKGEQSYNRYQINMPDNGVYIYKNLIRDKQTSDKQYYENKLNPKRIDRSIGLDLFRDAKYSVKQLSGIYGFIGDFLFGSDYNKFRYENAGQMASFTRGFWDASLGGLGGGLMEISRRFFPSTNKDIVNINPLRNNMAAWLPDSYRMGDPFVKIPKGEMRLPGKGYETLNELHPDQFATDGYGAFDRFKILADVAPYSDEYKIWSGIAKRTVTDPALVSQMEDIERRVKKKSGDHEFFEYRYINNNTEINRGIVKSVDPSGKIELQNGLTLTMAGVKPVEENQNQEQSIYDFIRPGDEINYQTTKDAIKNLDAMTEVTKAIIYKKDNTLFSSRNISKELIDAGIMEYDEEDTTPIAALAKAGAIGETLGGIQELIAHAPIPFLHNKFLKVETSLESYKNEQVYGSNFQTWDHPIQGFVTPALNAAFSQSMTQRAIAIGANYFHFNYGTSLDKKRYRFLSRAVMSTLDPSAFLFGAASWALRMNNGENDIGTQHSKTRGRAIGAFDRGAKIGSIIGTLGWGIANAKNPVTAATSFGLASLGIAEYLDDTADVLQRRLPKKILNNWFFKGEINTPKIAVAGAAIGLGVSAIRNVTSAEEEMFGPWIPKRTRKKYELDEYFDRLEYLKYEGLYKKAVRKAALHEKSSIGIIFKEIDKNKKKVGKLKKKALELSNKHMVGSYEYEEKMSDIKNKIASLEESQQIAFYSGGKYTKAAIAYKKAAESTIYGLNEGSSNDEILASVPNQYKDHFMAFMNETDKKKQKEILSYMPDYLQKPLQIAWGQDYEVRSNARYFRRKKLPNMAWKGWKPNVNMDHVKMKTIESEGMLLSEFGYYESEKSKAQYQKADAIRQRKNGSLLGVRAKLLSVMQGMGMPLTNISVEETSSPGISIFGDFQQQAQDVVSLTSYI